MNAHEPISQLLAFLRIVQKRAGAHNNTAPLVDIIAGEIGVPESSPMIFRAFLAWREIVDEVEVIFLRDNRLTEEGRSGLLQILQQLKIALSPKGMVQSNKTYIQNVSGIISHFATVQGFFGHGAPLAPDAETAVNEIISNIDDIVRSVQEADVDENAKKAVIASLAGLQLLLRNTDLLGFRAAFAAYLDLIFVLQSQLGATDAKSASFFERIWREVEKWSARITLINGAAHAGKGLAELAGPILRRALSS